ncbi:MAG: class I SAM-dependent methyltransferase [Promethearchaeota archaeon]
MMQVETIKFNKPNNQNDISVVEDLIYPIFTKGTKADQHYWNVIKSLFLSTMKTANLKFYQRHVFWFYVNRTITQGIKKSLPLIEVEEKLRKFLRKRIDSHDHEIDRKAIAVERAKRSFNLIKDALIGEVILDLGAGNGLLGLEITKQMQNEVLLVDVVDYNYTDLPLILYNPEEAIPLTDKEVDSTILYAVLHHTSDPEWLLKEATRITKKRLIIVEGYVEENDIRITNCFFDWFYNRVIGDEDINVPLNFLKLNEWKRILESQGFKISETIYLGINEPMVPEHQILIIADQIGKP